MNGKSVLLDFRQIGACASLKQFPVGVYLARTAAHEAGHKFYLSHPVRGVSQIPTPPDVQALTTDEFAWNPLTQDPRFYLVPLGAFYVRLGRYDYGAKTEVSEDLPTDIVGSALFENRIFAQDPIPPPPFPVPPALPCGGLSNCVYKVLVLPFLRTGAQIIQSQPGFIMDWAPRLTIQQLSDWKFDPGDPNQGRPNHLQSITVKYNPEVK